MPSVSKVLLLLAVILGFVLQESNSIPVAQYFGDDPWHGAAFHFWRPGYKWADVMHNMVKPSAQEEIYICGEAFSANYQGWVEGAIETCELVLQKISL